MATKCIQPYPAEDFPPESGCKEMFRLKVNMDAHLIGIDVAHLLLKQTAYREKQAPVKVKSNAESVMAAKEASKDSR